MTGEVKNGERSGFRAERSLGKPWIRAEVVRPSSQEFSAGLKVAMSIPIRILSLLLLLGFLLGLPIREKSFLQAQPVDEHHTSTSAEEGIQRFLPPEERSVARRIEQVKQLFAKNRFAEGVRQIAALLAEDLDYFIEPLDNEKENPTNRVTQRQAVEAMLRALPEEAKKLYAAQCGPEADRLLTLALERRSIVLMRTLVMRYFQTEAGQRAAMLLALRLYEEGNRASALLLLERIEQEGDAALKKSFEPMFGLSLASCRLHLDDRAGADAVLRGLLERYPELTLEQSNGKPWKPDDAAALLHYLERADRNNLPDVAAWLERVGWLSLKGTASEYPILHVDRPFSDRNWELPVILDFRMEESARLAGQAIRFVRDAVVLPAIEPLLVQDVLLFRGYDQTVAVDAVTGKRLWRVEEPEILLPTIGEHALSGISRISRRQSYQTPHPFVLRTMFWHDRLYHSLSSDGVHVYQIDTLDFLPSYRWGRPAPVKAAGLQMEDPRYAFGNTLTARDVRTGEIRWAIGKRPFAQRAFDLFGERITAFQRTASKTAELSSEGSEPPSWNEREKPKEEKDESVADSLKNSLGDEEEFLGKQIFLGAPLSVLGKLFVLSEYEGAIQLLVLDPRNGALLNKASLFTPTFPLENDWARRYYGSTPAFSEGVLLCAAGTGCVAAIDAATLRPLWNFTYAPTPRKDANNEMGVGGRMTGRYMHFTSGTNSEMSRLFSYSGWQVPATMIVGNKVFVAPADRPALYALDLLSGRLLWKNESLTRDGTLYIACAHEGKLFVVTPYSMVAVDQETGRSLWEDSGFRASSSLESNNPYGSLNVPGGIPRLFGRAVNVPDGGRPRQAAMPAVLSEKQGNPGEEKKTEESIRDREADEATSKPLSLPALNFPDGVLPAGRGVQDRHRYFLPLDDGTIAVIDLDAAVITERWKPRVSEDTWPPRPSTGNLLALRGRFFTVGPFQIVCYDQQEAVRRWIASEHRSEEGQDDSSGKAEILLARGRVAWSAGKMEEAIDLFRQSLALESSHRGRRLLYHLLNELLHHDFPRYRALFPEFLTLAKTSEELAEMLLHYAEAVGEIGDAAASLAAWETLIRLDCRTPVWVNIGDSNRIRLSRFIGRQMAMAMKDDAKATTSESRWRASAMASLSERLYRELREEHTIGPPDFTFWEGRVADIATIRKAKGPAETMNTGTESFFFPSRPTINALTPEMRLWRLFLDCFSSLPIAVQAEHAFLEMCRGNGEGLLLEQGSACPTDWIDSGLDRPVVFDDPKRLSSGDSVARLQNLSLLADYWKNRGLLSDAYHLYRQLDGEWNIPEESEHQTAFKESIRRQLRDPLFKSFRKPPVWPNGALVHGERAADNERENTGEEAIRSEQGKKSAEPDEFRFFRALQGPRFFGQLHRTALHHLGRFNPFVSESDFFLESVSSENLMLVCNDAYGKERWRLGIPGEREEGGANSFAGGDRLSGETELYRYVCSLNHLLLVVCGKEIHAVDLLNLDSTGTPRLLWSRECSRLLGMRRGFSAVSAEQFQAFANGAYYVAGRQSPGYGSSIHLADRAVCIREAGKTTALDPMTGEMIWQHLADAENQSLAGDEEHLFLLLPDRNEVVALELATGLEAARGALPSGRLVHLYRTNMLFLYTDADEVRLELYDLRDLFRSVDRRALALKISNDPGRVSVSRFTPRQLFSGKTNGNASGMVFRTVHHERFLAVIDRPQSQRVLHLFDLADGEEVCPAMTLFSPPGKESRGFTRSFSRGLADLDIEFSDGEILVLYIENREIRNVNMQRVNAPPQRNEADEKKERDAAGDTLQRQPIPGLLSRPIGAGTLMRYDRTGKPLWPEPVVLRDWFQLSMQPRGFPVALFGFLGIETRPRGNQQSPQCTGLKLVDKKNGKVYFSRKITPDPIRQRLFGPFPEFRITADIRNHELLLTTPQFDYYFRFVETPPSNTVTEKGTMLDEETAGEKRKMSNE